PISSMSVTDYTGFVTNVGTNAGNLFTPPGGTVGPADISRTAAGDTITFDFTSNAPSGVAAGVETLELVVKTNATAFKPGSINFLGGGIATVAGFAPALTTTTPEPAFAGLLLGALFGGGVFVARRLNLLQG